MKKNIILLFVLFISINLFASDYEISEEKIKDGPSVVFIDGNVKDYVSVSIFVKIGENLPGLAHLGEHLVFSSNKNIPKSIDFIFESYGATCDAYTNYDYSTYKYVINKKHLLKSLEYMSYALLNPSPSLKEFNIEKQIIKDEYSRKKYINFDYIRLLLQKSLYGDSYYGFPVEGDNIDNITLDDLYSFYSNNYISKNISIFIYGRVDKKEIIDSISKYYIQKDKYSFDVPIKVTLKNTNLYINGPKNYYGIMFPMAPSYKLKDAMICDVVSQMVDLLSSKIINEKYKYKSVYIHNTGRYASPFSLIYECDDIDFVKNSIEKTLEKIMSGDFTDYDLIDAQNILNSDFLAKNTNISDITYNTGFNYNIYNFETSYSYDKYIKQITRNDVVFCAKKYLTNFSTVVCEKEK